MTRAACPSIERRAFPEFRALAGARRLEGYAATFGAEARLGDFVETIEPGAFRASLDGDILALVDHDPGLVLGRTRSGTLRLAEDSRGLAFSLDLPDTQAGRDIIALAERGDIGGMSFGFLIPAGGQVWQGNRRSLRAIDLREVSVVQAFPAYPDTQIALRARGEADARAARRRAVELRERTPWA